ncbi:MAG: hypothetical protein HN368_05710 [Spirochaetales bacterium]|jgi:hypothetical protein|nr:hypothetical protein [Spirochaetales bacterium]
MRKKTYKSINWLLPAFAVFVLASFAACETPLVTPLLINGIPAGQIDLAIQGTAPAAVTTMAVGDGVTLAVDVTGKDGALIGTITLDEALLSLKEIEFELAETDEHADEEELDEADDTSTDFEGPFVVDLIADTITPTPDLTLVYSGVYEEIEIKLDKIEGDELDEDDTSLVENTDPLFGRSIYLLGTYDDGTNTYDFELAYDIDEEFELTGAAGTSEGFTVDENITNSIIIAFRLKKWFDFSNTETNSDDIDFTDLGLVSGDTITIDEDMDEATVLDEIRDVIKDNIKESADYGEDLDGDDELDSDEDDDPDEEDEEDD